MTIIAIIIITVIMYIVLAINVYSWQPKMTIIIVIIIMFFMDVSKYNYKISQLNHFYGNFNYFVIIITIIIIILGCQLYICC